MSRRGASSRWRSLAVALVVALLAMTVAAQSSQALPTRDIREVQAQVRDLQMQAAGATEEYKAAQNRLEETRQRLSTAQSKVDRERAELSQTLAAVNDLARGLYMSGGIDSALQVMLADDPTDFLAQSAAVDQLSRGQSADIRRSQTAQLRLAQAEAQLADQETLAQDQSQQMEAAKATADDRLQQAEDVLADLQEEERRRLAELQAQQREQEGAAAAALQASAPASGTGGSGSGGSSGAEQSGGGYTGGGRAAAAVQYALAQLGEPYSYSANPPNSWDCSKLTAAAWGAAGVGLTALSYTQWDQTRRVPVSEIQPGDLVFYFGQGAHHVAIYVGNGKMVSASNPSDGVELIDYLGPWYGERFSGVGRVL